jgi:hypothetical protein
MYRNWVHPFLVNLERTGSVAKSARLSGINSYSAYDLRKSDGDFRAAWDLALEDHTDRCEEELTRRAFGYEDPVVYQGQLTPVWERDARGDLVFEEVPCDPYQVGDQTIASKRVPRQARHPDGSLQWLTVTKFSDTLLLARVKAYRKRYATDRTEMVTSQAIDSMTDAELVAEFNALSKKLAALPKQPDDDLADYA